MKRSEFIWLVLQEVVKFRRALVFRRTRNRNKKEKVVLGGRKLSAQGKPGESLYICRVETAWVCLLTLEQLAHLLAVQLRSGTS